MTRIAPQPAMGQRRPRVKSRDHLAFIHELPCVVCLSEPVEAAHVRMGSVQWCKRGTGMAEKPRDTFTVPLCPSCHRLQHTQNEDAFWASARIDPFETCALLALHTGDVVTGRLAVQAMNQTRR